MTREQPASSGLEDRTALEKMTMVLEIELTTAEVFIKWLRKGGEITAVASLVTTEKGPNKIKIKSASTSMEQGERAGAKEFVSSSIIDRLTTGSKYVIGD